MNKPGYKHTSLGWIPEDWEVKELQDITQKTIVYGIVQAGPHINDGIPYIKSSDVGSDINTSTLQKTSFAIANKYKKSFVEPGDIAFSLRGNIGELSVVPLSLPKANLTQGTARISVKKDLTDYIKHALGGPNVRKNIIKRAKGSTFQEISLEQLRQLLIAIPPLNEYQYIGIILSTWDNAIAKEEQLIEKLELRHRGLMQQLLTGKKRLKGFQEKWKDKYIYELFTEVKDINDGNNHPAMTISSKYGLIYQQQKFDRIIAGESLNKYTLLLKGDFAYNKGNSKLYEMGCIYQLENAQTAVVPFVYICFRPTDLVEPTFYKYWFQSHGLDKQLKKIITSGARGDGLLNVDSNDFYKLRIPFPPIEEQKLIAKISTKSEQETKVRSLRLSALKQQKKGLMQVLLTGKIRVKPPKS